MAAGRKNSVQPSGRSQESLRKHGATGDFEVLGESLGGRLASIPLQDLRALDAMAHQRARKVLRNLSYPTIRTRPARPTQTSRKQPLGPTASLPPTSASSSAPAGTLRMRRSSGSGTPPVNAVSLEMALSSDKSADAVRYMAVEARKPLVEDFASSMREEARLEWVDADGLEEDLDDAVESEIACSPKRAASPPLVGPSLSTVSVSMSPRRPPEASRSKSRPFPRGIITSGVAGGLSMTQRRWPSLPSFERYYQPPLEALPPPPVVRPSRSAAELPPPRKTIASLEERVLSAAHAAVEHHWDSLMQLSSATNLSSQGPEAAAPSARQDEPEPVGMFEALAIYREAADQMGVTEMKQVPILSDRVFVDSMSLEDTRQAYALAEAVKACAPREVVLQDVFMTDMGAAKIVEAAVSGGRLTTLHISDSCLSYRTCAALFAAGHRGASIKELTIVQCGVGGDLPEEGLSELPTAVARVYAKCQAMLFEPDVDVLGFSRAPAGHRSASLWPEGSQMPVALPLFAHLVRPCGVMRHLDISGHALSASMVKCLSRALACESPLEELCLNSCRMVPESIDTFAEGLLKNVSLLQLGLRRSLTNAEPRSFSALLDAVGRHQRLAHLDLAESPLHSDCFRDLCATLRWSCSLLAIHVLGGAPFENAAKVEAAIKKWVSKHGAGMATAVSRGGTRTSRDFNNNDERVEVETSVDDFSFAEDEESDELVVSRALHIEGLSAWKAASLSSKVAVSGPEAQPQAGPQLAASPSQNKMAAPALKAGADVPSSWMPGRCWICERCRTVEYKWTVPDHGDGSDSGAAGARLFLRPSFADFEPIELRRRRSATAKKVQFATHMLVPPGEHCHLFEARVPGPKRADREKSEVPASLLHAREEVSEQDFSKLPISEQQRSNLQRACVQMRYAGPANLRSIASEEDFKIPENAPPEDPFEVEPDPWKEDPPRVARLRRCFEADLPKLRLHELCQAEEENEAKQALWELYDRLYETYAIYAGRSQWPLVRHVDVYSFFDEAQLLHATLEKSQESTSTMGDGQLSRELTALSPLQSATGHGKMLLQDVKLILMQTRAKAAGRHNGVDPGQKSSHNRRAEIAQQQAIESAPITRPQFIEMLVRTAIATRSDNPPVNFALRSFVDNVLAERIFQPPMARFPRGLQWQPGEVQDKLLAGRKTLLEAWERFGNSEGSFQRFAQLLRVNDRHFTAKHVASVYGLARQPDPDAILRPASLGLGYEEFVEAVARMAMTWQSASRNAQRVCSSGTQGSSADRLNQFNLQPGGSLRQKAIATHIAAFIAKVDERLKPAVKVSPSLL